jgi:hypothetical protein
VALVEVYDMQESPSSKLVNISTRGVIGTGDDVLIGGTIVKGPDPGRVLFRALGPSLASAGITNALPNPQLAVFDSAGTKLASNDDWTTDGTPVLVTGLAPASPMESGLVADLPPGAYTAVVSGVSGGTGIALFEAYHLR